MKTPDESAPPVAGGSVEEDEDRIRHWIEALFGDTPDGVAISCSGRVLYANGRTSRGSWRLPGLWARSARPPGPGKPLDRERSRTPGDLAALQVMAPKRSMPRR